MASARPDWRPSERTLREERERGQAKVINPKPVKGPTLEEMLAQDEAEQDEQARRQAEIRDWENTF